MLYSALAKDILALYPPEMVVPLSPITVLSEFWNITRSDFKHEIFSTSSYKVLLNSLFKTMLNYTVPGNIKGSYSTNAIFPLCSKVPENLGVSFNIE